jgi:hypothetical protein
MLPTALGDASLAGCCRRVELTCVCSFEPMGNCFGKTIFAPDRYFVATAEWIQSEMGPLNIGFVHRFLSL